MRSDVRGFTLIEMVIAISLTGLVAALMAVMAIRHMESYVTVAQRGSLAGAGNSALAIMARDFSSAETVRAVENGIEWRTKAGHAGRYSCGRGVLTRFVNTKAGGLTPAVMASGVERCEFVYKPRKGQGRGRVAVVLQLAEEGERIVLLPQFPVADAP